MPISIPLIEIKNGHLDFPSKPALDKIKIHTAPPLPPVTVLETLLATMVPSPGEVMCPRDPPLKAKNPVMIKRVPVATN